MGNAKLTLCFCICAAGLHGGVVYDASASLTGTRSISVTGGLLDGGGDAYDGLMLSWSIAALPNSTYQYTYTLTTAAEDDHEGPPVNHLILESDGCNAAGTNAACVSNVSENGAPAPSIYGAWSAAGNPGLQNSIQGVDFAELPRPGTETAVISFISPNAPVWGDVYLTGGSQYVFNLGNLNHADTNTMDFVAVPAGELSPAPEPSTLLLAGVALTVLGLIRRGRRGS